MNKYALSVCSINLGRLYQGKYVPPDRVDGLLTLPEAQTEAEAEAAPVDAAPDAAAAAAATAEDLDLD
jgi:hypothetical protein